MKIIPETMDDLWHLYNVIHKRDEVYARTTRQLKVDEKYARPERGERVSVFVGITIESVSWDKFSRRLRVHGIICQAPENCPSGVHHTLNITLNMPVTIVKKEWPEHQLERLERACRTSERPLIILSIDDDGYAIAETAQFGLEQKVEERVKLPGKLESEKRSAAVNEFFKKSLDNLRQEWIRTGSPIVIIGVGFFKNDFVTYLRNEASDVAHAVRDVKSVNSGGMTGINEALRSGVLLKTMKQLRIGQESESVEEILRRLGKGETNVAYGFSDVQNAAKIGAVDKMIVADSSLREVADEERLRLESVMRDVEQKRGGVMVISTEHEAGIKLLSLGGVAALLRFPVQ